MPLCDCQRLLHDVAQALEALNETGQEQILYLTQPPLTDADQDFLLETLGRGSITIFSNDPNASAWQETKVPCVWLGEYRDGIERVVLKTIEIAPYPRMAGWERESVSEALVRLKEIQAKTTNSE
ncbi:MAG: hydrogenase expression/formation C-terminal domain-containing protein [Terriglobia bacterium]